MTTHTQYTDLFAAYLAGGLSQAERGDVEAHLALCDACRETLDQLAQSDRHWSQLFAAVRPDDAFEERIIGELRAAPFRRRLVISPTFRRAFLGLAATMVLGGLGYSMGNLIENNALPGAPRMKVAARTGLAQADVAHPVQDLRAAPSTITTPPDFDLSKASKARGGEPKGEDAESKLRLTESTLAADASTDTLLKKRLATGGLVERSYAPPQDRLARGDHVTDWASTDLASNSGGGKIVAPVSGDFSDSGVNDTYGLSYFSDEPGSMTHHAAVKGLRVDGSQFKLDGTAPAAAQTVVTTPPNFWGMQLAQAGVNRPAGEPKDKVAVKDAKEHAAGVTLSYRNQAGDDGQSAPDAPKAADPVKAAQGQSAPQPQAPPPALQQRKIIRNGEMEFEVDSFDSTYMNIAKIAAEEQGFVASTNSEKLANGKVRGEIIVRVPPEHLDTLVLKLRALGDLKNQKISAQDVTKVYYDLEAELRGSKAMEERMLSIIKSGKGEIKDLIEAEKQYGIYREKSEKLEGEIRYYNSLISLSTLKITAAEKDIKTPVAAAMVETVNMGIEAEDVEKSRADAIKAIEEAKGRIIESTLKKHDAGKFDAMIEADVPPDASGPLTDRLRQLGRVERFDIDRKQTTQGGTGAPIPGTRLEKRDTHFSISLYNLANLEPRQATNLSLAVENVEEAYRAILEAVRAKNGRVLESKLNRLKPDQTTATMRFEVPTADADATLNEIRRGRDVMSMNVTESPNAASGQVTAAKRGFAVSISPLAQIRARQTETSDIAIRGSLPDAYHKLLDEARRIDARILVSQLNEQDRANLAASLEVEVSRLKEADFRSALAAAGITIQRTVVRSPDVENTVDSKVHLVTRMLSVDVLEPRDTQSIGIAAKDVASAYQQLLASVKELGAHVIKSQLDEQNREKVSGELTFDVMGENQAAAQKLLSGAGAVYSKSLAHSPNIRAVEFKTRYSVTLMAQDQLAPRETGRVKVEVNNVEQAAADLESAALKNGGRTIDSSRTSEPGSDRVTAHFTVNLPLKNADAFRSEAYKLGRVRESNSTQKPDAPQGEFARAQFEVDLVNAGSIVSEDEGFGASVRHALSVSVAGLLWSLERILIGILVIGPWLLIAWGAWKVVKRRKAAEPPPPAPTPAA